MWQGVLLGLIGAASWACANVAIKRVSEQLGAWSAMVWAQLIGGGLVTLVALLTLGPPGGLDAPTCGWIALAGLSAALAYAGLFTSLTHGRVAVVTPVISSWTVLSVIIGAALLDEPLSAWVAGGVAAVVAGNALLAGRRGGPASGADAGTRAAGDGEGAAAGGAPPGERTALLWALAAAVGFGVMTPAVATAGARVGRLWTVPLVWAVELALVVPLLLWRGKLAGRPRGPRQWWITGRAALFEVAGFVAISFALGAAPVAVVSPLASLATAGSVLLGLLLLRERPGGRALAGAALASLGVVLVNLH